MIVFLVLLLISPFILFCIYSLLRIRCSRRYTGWAKGIGSEQGPSLSSWVTCGKSRCDLASKIHVTSASCRARVPLSEAMSMWFVWALAPWWQHPQPQDAITASPKLPYILSGGKWLALRKCSAPRRSFEMSALTASSGLRRRHRPLDRPLLVALHLITIFSFSLGRLFPFLAGVNPPVQII